MTIPCPVPLNYTIQKKAGNRRLQCERLQVRDLKAIPQRYQIKYETAEEYKERKTEGIDGSEFSLSRNWIEGAVFDNSQSRGR